MTELLQEYAPAQRAVFARLRDGEGVIVDTATAFYYGLNRTGVFLWETIAEGNPVSAGRLVDSLCGRFAVDNIQATDNVQGFLTELEKYRLLVRVTG